MTPRKVTQTEMLVDGVSFILDPGVDVEELKDEMRLALASSGEFVDFTALGNRRVSVLISPRSRVLFRTADVDVDADPAGAVMIRNDQGNWDLL